MHKLETSGSLHKWTVELNQFDVEYKPRGALKGQTLANFILEFPPQSEEDSVALIAIPGVVEPFNDQQNYAPWWALSVDGAVNNEGSGARIELITPEGHKLRSAIHFTFKATNNDIEYDALIIGLKLALEMRVENLNVYSDSMLVTHHIGCGWQARDPELNSISNVHKESSSFLTKYLGDSSVVVEAEFRFLPFQASLRGRHRIYLIGELPKAKGRVKYVVVAVDYFTKWAKAEPLDTITAKTLKDFVYRAIVCWYGIPYQLISDNGKHFDSKEMREFCEALGIKKGFSAVSHPQTNWQTEAINKIIKHTLKAKLEESKENWPEELPKVLWSYNTTPRSTTRETPFSLS
ncbi:uncharacterized protein LOC141673582 [Apium graveolens]|uniref:uncharacterized protein LOC141673582 n=1 Tax=Apium graveolens TaxID=4045 RepID=UPI003D7A08B3